MTKIDNDHDIDIDISGDGHNTKLCYMYRDGGNYKTDGEVNLSGRLTEENIQKILNGISYDLGFLPLQVGLPGLQKNWDDEIDHVWHTISSIEYTTDEDTIMSADQLVANWPSDVSDWDVVTELNRVDPNLSIYMI